MSIIHKENREDAILEVNEPSIVRRFICVHSNFCVFIYFIISKDQVFVR